MSEDSFARGKDIELCKTTMLEHLDILSDGLVLIKSNLDEFEIIDCNLAFESFMGYSKTFLKQKSLKFFLKSGSAHSFLKAIEQAFLNKKISYVEYTSPKKNTYKCTIIPVSKDQLVDYCYIVMEFIKDEPKNNLEYVGLLTSGMAHDFNHTLAVIQSSLDILKIKYKEDSNLLKYLENISLASQKGSELIADLGLFINQKNDKNDIVDLSIFLKKIEQLIKILFKDRPDINLKIFDSQIKLDISEQHLIQIINNVCLNAKQAMPSAGTLTIEAKAVKGSDFAELSISDTGLGIAPELKNKIFEPFFSSNSDCKNLGLGLSNVQRILTQHGGHLEIESVPGSTMFKFFLRKALPVSNPIDTGKNFNILVLERSESSLSSFLAMEGYAIQASQSLLTKEEVLSLNCELVVIEDIFAKYKLKEFLNNILLLRPEIRILLIADMSLSFQEIHAPQVFYYPHKKGLENILKIVKSILCSNYTADKLH